MIEIPQLCSNGLKAVDLFCGVGIGAYGIKKAGYDIIFGIDNSVNAIKTYNTNIGDHGVCGDIRKLKSSDIPQHDLMIATPVCKPFSVCGARRLTDDEKYGDLLAETIRLFSECKPKALFFENVKGLVLEKSKPIFLEFVYRLESYGYYVYWSVENCLDYGVPQERERVFLVAIRTDIPNEFIKPEKLLFGKKSQRDAFYDLKDKTIEDVKNHNTDYVVHHNDTFVVKNRQRGWDLPSNTVISEMNSVPYYPEPLLPSLKYITDGPRRLSVRESLRLQTVGDDFYFPDDIPLSVQYERCSGIPSLISYKYGIAIADCLLGKTPLRKDTKKLKKLF